MKVLHISASDGLGGAGIAANRLHTFLRHADIDSEMLVARKTTSDETIKSQYQLLPHIRSKTRSTIGRLPLLLQQSSNTNYHSCSLLPSKISKYVNDLEDTLVHLHWVQGEMMSIHDIGNIRIPFVLTLHDVWPLCGCEHQLSTTTSDRILNGYTSENRDPRDKLFDLDKFCWLLKRKNWNNVKHLISPSTWLYNLARNSCLFDQSNHYFIPHPLDEKEFYPHNKETLDSLFRKYKLDPDSRYVLFASSSPATDKNKGFETLTAVIDFLQNIHLNAKVLIAGPAIKRSSPLINHPRVHYLGKAINPLQMNDFYNLADVVMVPSQHESFGLVAAEAQLCGKPVVAYKTSGLLDVVAHKRSGILVDCFDKNEFCLAIARVLARPDVITRLSILAYSRAKSIWNYSMIVQQHTHVYEKVVSEYSDRQH